MFVCRPVKQRDTPLQNEGRHCTECSDVRHAVKNVSQEYAALQKTVTELERNHNIFETSQIKQQREIDVIKEDVEDLKTAVGGLSSRLQDMKVSHSVASHEDKWSVSVILFPCTLHCGP